MPLEQHPTDPDKVVYVGRNYGIPQLQGVTTTQRPWVDLTDEEVLQIRENLQVVEGISLLENLTKAIGAALRSKNA